MNPRTTRARTDPAGSRIEDVARAAGVSAITVSRTLNQPDTVAEPTRKAVWAAIEKIGYIHNRLAAGLASRGNASRAIGVVLPYITNPAFAERIEGMSEVFSAQGYQLLLGLSAYVADAEMRHVMGFLGQRVAALALTGNVHSQQTRKLLARAGIPVVELPLITGPVIDMAVGYSNEGACHAMVEYLARCGYRKIGLLSTPVAGDQIVLERRTGYLRAVEEFGLPNDPSLMIESSAGYANSAKAFAELLGRHPDIDALFCTSDIHAIGSMLEARRRGIGVPDDIGIAGYDDIELAREFVPALTTVRINRFAMGRMAARMLLQRIRGETPPESTVDVGFEIVGRNSTRRPRS